VAGGVDVGHHPPALRGPVVPLARREEVDVLVPALARPGEERRGQRSGDAAAARLGSDVHARQPRCDVFPPGEVVVGHQRHRPEHVALGAAGAVERHPRDVDRAGRGHRLELAHGGVAVPHAGVVEVPPLVVMPPGEQPGEMPEPGQQLDLHHALTHTRESARTAPEDSRTTVRMGSDALRAPSHDTEVSRDGTEWV
jgi:hypothetical protein